MKHRDVQSLAQDVTQVARSLSFPMISALKTSPSSPRHAPNQKHPLKFDLFFIIFSSLSLKKKILFPLGIPWKLSEVRVKNMDF